MFPAVASYPTDARYTDTHLWVRPGDTYVTFGLTQFAADEVGAIRMFEPPYPGEIFDPGDVVFRLFTDTGTTTMRMPFRGRIHLVNPALQDAASLVNSDPYGHGWLLQVQPADLAEVESLMDAADYEASLATGE